MFKDMRFMILGKVSKRNTTRRLFLYEQIYPGITGISLAQCLNANNIVLIKNEKKP